MEKRKALVTGITGQDGGYLAQLLLNRGYEVVGAARRNSTFNNWRLRELGIEGKFEVADMELSEFSNIHELVRRVRPSVIFNLAAQSFVGSSFNQPLYVANVDGLAVLRFLDSIRLVDPEIRFYQASTSEMFGKVQQKPQTELTPFHPRSPYGVAKLYGHWITVNYRESYDLHLSSGILFNHESPMRGREFVTRKITSNMALYRRGLAPAVRLGNIDAIRDWGFAGDYVKGMLAMVEAPKGGDFVLATGETHSVREFATFSARAIGIDIVWEGEGENERGLDRATGKPVVEIDPKFYRPAEVEFLLGDASKAKQMLGWRPEVSFEALVDQMVKVDCDRVDRNQPLL